MGERESLATLSIKGILRLYGQILDELKERGVSTTRDNPIGGYGEWLVTRAFGGKRRGNSNKGTDVVVPDGTRLQVKTRWLPMENGSRQLGAIRNLEGFGFDYVVAVLLDKNFDVAEAYQLPHSAIARLTSWAKSTSSHRLVLTPKVCRDGECTDITDKIRGADPERQDVSTRHEMATQMATQDPRGAARR